MGAHVKVRISKKGPGWEHLRRVLKELGEGTHVKVGVLDDGGSGSDDHGDGKHQITNAELAAIHEFGSSDGRIPERSFIRSTFEAGKKEYVKNLRELLRRIISGQGMTLERALGILGLKISTDIKKRVTTGEQVPPPNAPSTVARKEALRRKGSHGAVRTLVDTGRMIASVTWAIVRGGK